MAKLYKDYSVEEKAEYKEKRDAYWAKRQDVQKASFDALEAELSKLNNARVMELFKVVKQNSLKGERSGSVGARETYLTALFDTETPAVGEVRTFQEIGIRGTNGERMQKGETFKEFALRVEDVVYKHDAQSINQMVWYVNRRDVYTLDINKEARIVTVKAVKK